MKTLEDAIYYLENSSKYLPNDIWDGTAEIIEMLKHGEKNGKIVRDIKNMFEIRKDRRGGEWTGNNILLNIKDIEQKHFPKNKEIKK